MRRKLKVDKNVPNVNERLELLLCEELMEESLLAEIELEQLETGDETNSE